MTSYSAPMTSLSRQCRDRFGLVDEVLFRRRACALCYTYLFPVSTHGLVAAPPFYDFLQHISSTNESETGNDEPDVVILDPINATTLEVVCTTLTEPDACSRLEQCCFSAIECCNQQQLFATKRGRVPAVPSISTFGLSIGARRIQPELIVCSSTWDGFSCWDETEAGHIVKQSCPIYIHRADISRKYCICNDCFEVSYISRLTFMSILNYISFRLQ